MVRTSSITMRSMVRIVGRAPVVDEKCDVFLYVSNALGLRSL